MRRVQKILLCFILLYFLLFLKSYASIDQSKVVKLDDAKYQISYYDDTYLKADFYVSDFQEYSSDYEYMIVLTNGDASQPKLTYNSEDDYYTSDIGLSRSLHFKSTSYDVVPQGKGAAFGVEGALEKSGDIRAWIYATDNSGNSLLIKGNISIARPNRPEKYDKFDDDSFYGKIGINITVDVPRDVWVKRSFNVKIGEVNDYNLLLKLKDNYNNSTNLLYQFAENDRAAMVDTKLETPLDSEITYYECYRSDMPIPNILDIGNRITQGDYYYIFVDFDDENGKYIPVSSVSIFQAGSTYTDIWALYKVGSTQFNWDNIDKYQNMPTNTIEDNTTNDLNIINEADNQVNDIEDNQINNIVEDKSNNINEIDNTLAEEELPYTGLELRVLYILFILLCVTYYRYKKIKFGKKD